MLALAFLIISSTIGAGFASGAELVAFFGTSPLPVWAIALIVGVCLFAFMGAIVYLNERGFRPPSIIFLPLYFAFFTTMTAGLVHLIGICGAVISLVLCIGIVLNGFERLLSANKVLMIFVMTVLFAVVFQNVGYGRVFGTVDGLGWGVLAMPVIYAGMNCLLFPVLKRARAKFSLRITIVACALSSTVIALFVWAMLSSIDRGTGAAMPVLALADNFLVRAAIFLSIFSSQYIALFNIDQELRRVRKPQRIIKLSAVSVIAFALSLFGFSNIVGTVYPAVGVFMTLFLISSCVICLIRRQTRAR